MEYCEELTIIVNEEYCKKTMVCELSICWNIPYLTRGRSSSSGYIVQHVYIDVCSAPLLSLLKSKEYYEAWPVSEGRIDTGRQNIVEYDDSFSIGKKLGTRFDSIADCLLTKGRLSFSGNVYWVPSDAEVCRAIGCWKCGGVSEAGDLRSVEGSNLDPSFANELTPFFIGKRRPLRHEWNCVDPNVAYDILLEEASRYIHNDKNHRTRENNLMNCLGSFTCVRPELESLASRVKEQLLQ